MKYFKFLQNKAQISSEDGFNPVFMPNFLFDFQKHLIEWSLKGGRRAVFADCGMGKTPMQLVWAQNIVQKFNKPILVVAPLSVSLQTIEEAEKFNIETVRSMNGGYKKKDKIIITNYERLHYFNPKNFKGIVCDESSIMKNFDGTRKTEITNFMQKIKYRLLCTATAAPNDYIELGTSSEALGHMGYMDMLSHFFKNDQDSISPAFYGAQWRFKHHAEEDFWHWMVSWSRACRKPSDLGFKNNKFILPSLIEKEHIIENVDSSRQRGFFTIPSKNWKDQREDVRESIQQRCELAADKLKKVKNGIAWCHLNKESEVLTKLIKGAVEIKGSDSDEKKEEVFTAFRHGEIRVLVTKPKIAAFGMNWQHCSDMTYFPTHSYEQYYQAIRRCWRFGQKKKVNVHLITTEALIEMLKSMRRKSKACDKMFNKLVEKMNKSLYLTETIKYERKVDIPSWTV